ncbi:FadR/GntR family transcriptional regulator [Nocardiopsis flavescens]|uniref:GntR family transcriptional regulator, transcriptional repressor for pyruvate dehydrogenase complex n=1 Tax=Nocardiopsis flavescens TaxID=758803 RepID=A0A1M6LAX8_9ACTN|nr:FadR/GntR family transcriptional regulator [Nocardiopsis flavescens]SHJ68356.1 GntR family transcriptional regulator, transcriptional repressor for pyruvate dehydrogenase complex [Nocardiopsis flavescens]
MGERGRAEAFRAVERSKVYSSVAEEILAGVRAGVFPPGDPLPAERVLAERFEVGRGSVREAIRVLEHAGILDVRVGSGTYVVGGGDSRTTVLRARAAMAGEHSPLDLVVARASLEPSCAEHAAAARTSKDLRAIEEALLRQERITREGGDPSGADADFHLAVAAASHNSVLSALERSLVDLMREPMWSEMKHRSRSRGERAERYLEQHRQVFRAIGLGDRRRARQVMAAHMCDIETDLLTDLESARDGEDPAAP